MFGLAFTVLGLEFLSLAVQARVEKGFSVGVVVEAVFALAVVSIGIRIFRNGFPRPPKN
jgi:hypothetical protein